MPTLKANGIAASDMAESIRFYRALGLDMPETPGEGHVEAVMPGGARLMLDSEEIILSFLPDWKRVDGNQVSLAFECERPAEVDEIYARVSTDPRADMPRLVNHLALRSATSTRACRPGT